MNARHISRLQLERRQTVFLVLGARKRLTFIYRGVKRVVEPHFIGVNHWGNDVLLAWCVKGLDDRSDFWGENTPPGPGWRIYNLRLIRNPVIGRKKFGQHKRGLSSQIAKFRRVYYRAFPIKRRARRLPSVKHAPRRRVRRGPPKGPGGGATPAQRQPVNEILGPRRELSEESVLEGKELIQGGNL